MSVVIVSSKGQVVIPAVWREELGFSPGRLAQVIKTGVGVLVRPLAKKPIDACFGKFTGVDLYGAIREGRKVDLKHEQKLVS